MRKWIVFTVAGILASGTLLAQRGPRDDRRRGQRGQQQQTLQEAVGLSEEQRSEIDDIRRAARDEVREIFQAARENRDKLREEMRKESPDSAVVGRLMVEMQSTGKNAEAKRDEMEDKARAVLTDEQSAKLAEMEGDPASARALMQARSLGLIARPDRGGRRGPQRGFGRRGPGGPGGRGPGGFDRGRGRRGFGRGQSSRGGRGFAPQRNSGRQGSRRQFQRGPGRGGAQRFRGAQGGGPRGFRGPAGPPRSRGRR